MTNRIRRISGMASGGIRVLADTARGLGLDMVSAVARAEEATSRAIARNRRQEQSPRGDGSSARPGLASLRVNVLILSDEDGIPLTTAARLAPSLELADRVFRDRAGIRVRCTDIVTVKESAPPSALDPHADRGLLLDEIVGRTAFYREHLAPRRPLALVGDPITIVVVRRIAGRATGCSLGMTADWVIVQASLFDSNEPSCYDDTVLAHELGHAMNLPHHRDPANLMSGVSSPADGVRGTTLHRWQALLLQGNRHTIPPA
jgi:hypothetical protein